MKFQRKKVAAALTYMLGLGGAALLVGVPAQAQDIRVDVTGSNIKRVEGEGALPVQTITRQEIENTGVTSAAEILDKLSANQSFNNFNESQGFGSSFAGFSGASLRGLGYGRTLVLLNGRRITAFALADGSGVDLASIPLSAIERVEVLKDGASAVYGTDAIAGVINFVLRKDFTGYEGYAYYMDTQDGGGKQYRLTAGGGWGDLAKDKWNAFISFDYNKQEALAAADREISKTAYVPSLGVDGTSGNSLPANISIPGVSGARNPNNPACIAPFSFPTTGSPRQCRFDFASVIDTFPEFEKTNIVGKATWQFSPDHQLFLEGTYFKADYTYRISPTPVAGSIMTNSVLQLKPSSPYYPASFITSVGGDPTKPVDVSWRALELGARTSEVNTEQYRFVAGLQGVVFKNWDYAAAFNYTENRGEENFTQGYLSEQILAPILNSGVVNFFGMNSAAVVSAMNAAQITGNTRSDTAKNYGVDGRMSNEIYQMPAGPLAFALGGEWRRESLEQINQPILSSGDIIGGSGTIPSTPEVSRDVTAVFVEFNVPIVKNLEANLAVRYDHYSDFGNTTNPKISLRWQPAKDFLLRGAWGTGFRAPTLSDMFKPELTTNTAGSYDDPLRCPITQGINDCNLQFNSRQGGNPNLTPEKSTQWYVGTVWDPTPNVSVGIDYFNIEIKDVFTSLLADTIFADYPKYSYLVVRGPTDPQYPNLPGPIDYVIEKTNNVAKQTVSGIDVNLTARAATDFGNFKFDINGTYTIDYKQSSVDDPTLVNYVGQRGSVGAISRWRHYAQLDWNRGGWGATLAQTFQNGYTEPSDVDDSGERRVGSYSIWDLQGRYTGFKNTTLALGIKNLFNQEPPPSTQRQTFIVGYDPSYGDPRGLMWYGSVRYTFK
jgi:iron complex outermembrane receptor protein